MTNIIVIYSIGFKIGWIKVCTAVSCGLAASCRALYQLGRNINLWVGITDSGKCVFGRLDVHLEQLRLLSNIYNICIYAKALYWIWYLSGFRMSRQILSWIPNIRRAGYWILYLAWYNQITRKCRISVLSLKLLYSSQIYCWYIIMHLFLAIDIKLRNGHDFLDIQNVYRELCRGSNQPGTHAPHDGCTARSSRGTAYLQEDFSIVLLRPAKHLNKGRCLQDSQNFQVN